MSDRDQRIAALPPDVQSLLVQRLTNQEQAESSRLHIPRREGAGPCPASFAQQRLWFLAQIDPDSPVYNVCRTIRMRGILDVEALRAAFDALVARHEALRTTVAAIDGDPVQVIHEQRSMELPVIDLTEWPAGERESEASRLIGEHARTPFDLSRDLMLRVLVLRSGEEAHQLLLVMHHIASDGWSMDILFRELGALYQAFCAGKPSPLPELPIQYADYAQWQRGWLQGEALDTQLAYWKEKLGANPPTLELATDHPRPKVQKHRGGRVSLEVSAEVTESLKELSRRQGVTLFVTLLAAFQTLLYRYSGQDDIVVGTAIAGRTRAETEGLIGFFVNTLALRGDLSGAPTFVELLGRVREVALEAYSHQELPFEMLVGALQTGRSLNHSPVFQVMFGLQNGRTPELELAGLEVSWQEVGTETAKFELTLNLRETESGLSGWLEYDRDLFEAITIRRMRGHLENLLRGIVKDPDRCLSELPMLKQEERRQLLVEWNDTGDTQEDYARDRCIHHLFEDQVERTPEAIAVVFGDDQLTYSELNRQANQLAHYLRRKGIRQETLVGICLERSVEMVVGLLATLKAGGVYVPLDPEYPLERLAFMLEDTRAPVLLTRRAGAERFGSMTVEVISFESNGEAIGRESEENPGSEVDGESLAYINYTSGSTGEPKGICIPHRAVNRLVWNTNYIELAPTDRVAQASNASFDAATFEIWGALLNGARLVGISTEALLDPERLAECLREEEITVLFLTTAVFNRMGQEEPGAFRSLKYLLFGGEAVEPRWVREVVEGGPPEHLLHVYGPTESTTFAAWHRVEEIPAGATTIPIGRPIRNTQIYLLDRHLQPVPVGVAGELCIGGDGLARGYLSRPSLTEEKFVPDPYGGEGGGRLYRTGDQGKYLPGGEIEFLGRMDDQVKIRGFRVEPGEIKAVLAQHPGVRRCEVIVQEELDDDPLAPARSGRRLVAYVVSAANPSPTTGELRVFLKEKLPAYMVPASFEFLDEIPLTPNGKLDRRALPDATRERPALEVGSTLVPGSMEYRLAKLFEKTLAVQPVGLDDDFFELGGHSLLAASLFHQIQKEFGKPLPLSTLFDSPTVRQLTNRLRDEGITPPLSSLVELQTHGNKPPFFCVHAVRGNILSFHSLARHLAPDQPFYGLQPQGLDKNVVPYTRIEDMAAHYIREIRTVQPNGPYFLGGRSLGCCIAFEMARQFQEQGDEVGFVALFDGSVPGYGRVRRQVSLRERHRIDHHMRNLGSLGPRAKLGYVTEKFANLYGKHKEKLWRRTWEVGHWVSTRTGWPLPRAFRDVFCANLHAMKNYSFQEYQGAVTVFRSDDHEAKFADYDPELGWGRFAVDGVESIAIPGGHNGMWEEPSLSVVVEALRSCLHKKQSTAPLCQQ